MPPRWTTCPPCIWTGSQPGISEQLPPPPLAASSASCQTLSKEVPQNRKYAEKNVLFRPPARGPNIQDTVERGEASSVLPWDSPHPAPRNMSSRDIYLTKSRSLYSDPPRTAFLLLRSQ